MSRSSSHGTDLSSKASSDDEEGFVSKTLRLTRLFFKNITIEPILFSFGMIYATAVITPTLYYDKICKVGSYWFGNGTTFSEDVCDHLDNGNHTEEQIYVQTVYSKIHMVTAYGSAIPAALAVLFLGPWSDRAGRKLLILLTLSGFIFSQLVLLINAIFFYELKVEFMILEMFSSIFGGTGGFFMACYSYISDITNDRTRTSRISLMDCAIYVAITIAYPVHGEIFASYGFVAVYSTTLGALVLAVLYCLFLVKDSLKISRKKAAAKAAALREKMAFHGSGHEGNKDKLEGSVEKLDVPKREDEPEKKMKFRHIFSFKNAFQSFEAAFRKRDGGMRHVVILMLLIFFFDGVASGVTVVDFSYTKIKFEWESNVILAKWWSRLSSYGGLLSIIAVGALGPLMSRVLKMSDMLIVTLAMIGKFLCYFIYLIADVKGLFFLAETCRMLADFGALGVRSSLIKIVRQSDAGKIFACVALVQSSTLFVYPLFNWIYLETLEWHYGLVYCISDTILLLLIAMAAYCYVKMKKYEKHIAKTVDHIEVNVVTIPGVNHDNEIPVIIEDKIYK